MQGRVLDKTYSKKTCDIWCSHGTFLSSRTLGDLFVYLEAGGSLNLRNIFTYLSNMRFSIPEERHSQFASRRWGKISVKNSWNL